MNTLHTAVLHAAAGDLNTDGLKEWAVSHIVPIVLVVIGLSVMISREKLSKHLGTLATIIIACIIIGGADFFLGLGDFFAGLLSTSK